MPVCRHRTQRENRNTAWQRSFLYRDLTGSNKHKRKDKHIRTRIRDKKDDDEGDPGSVLLMKSVGAVTSTASTTSAPTSAKDTSGGGGGAYEDGSGVNFVR